jgi:peptidoglycan/LPS O-acetylase OafA/YrhL
LNSKFIPPNTLIYRPDIDGLRALAVILIILFHAFPGWVHGGFIGVDIFFVISGFLITSIILRDLKTNQFSFIWFYCKRIIRIFPALLLVLICSIFLGWIFLYPDEYQLLGKHLISAAGFFSNFTYLGEAGYFDARAVEKPLLHLWSLAIEEQFYLIWPLILWLGYKSRFSFALLILTLGILSFIINIYAANHYLAWDFYSPLSRFWELLSGSLLAYVMLNRDRIPQFSPRISFICIQTISILGIIAVAIGITITYAHSRFPGWLALLPVLGAVMLISAGPNSWINRYFLANRVMVGIGLISYPLYLWHWVLLSFAQIWGAIFLEQRIFLLSLSLSLSWLTYLFIEKPLRNNLLVKKKALLLILAMIAVFFAGVLLTQNGFENRYINQLKQFSGSGEDGGDGGVVENGCGLSDSSLIGFFHGCHKDRRETAKFAILGDSHALSLWPGLVRTSHPGNRWLTINGPGGPQNLRPYLSNTRENVAAKDSVYTDKAIDQIVQNKNIQVVLLTFSSNSLLPSMADASDRDQIEAYKGLESIAAKLGSTNKKVVLLIDNPHLASPQDCFHREVGISIFDNFNKIDPKCEITIDEFHAFTAKYRKVLKDLAIAHPNLVYVFDTTPYVCSVERGICSYQKDGRRMYSYGAHITDYASGIIGDSLNKYLIEIANGK